MAMVVMYSHRKGAGRCQTLRCKSCDHRMKRDVGDQELAPVARRPNSNRRFSDETVLEIRARGASSQSTWAQLGAEYGASREAIRQIVLGLAYRDLLPDDFVAPNNGRKCWHCTEWRGMDDEIHPCKLGMPDVLTEGEGFAADCEFYVRKGS
jgi:hypothetical protein